MDEFKSFDDVRGIASLTVSSVVGIIGTFFTFVIKNWVARIDEHISGLQEDDRSMSDRLSRVETSTTEVTSRLDRIEDKIDRLLTGH